MIAWLQRYPYLCLGLVMLALLGALLPLCSPRQRRNALLSATVFAPSGFWELLAVPDYWDPARVFVVLKTGPEDILFCFAAGGLSWLIGTWAVRDRIVLAPRTGPFLRRGLICTTIFLSLQLFLRYAGVCAGGVVLLSTGGIAAMVLGLGGFRWCLAAWGGLGYGVFHFLLLSVVFAALPHFPGQWNSAGLCGPIVAGVPFDEIAWGVLFGAGWPLAVSYALGARLRRTAALPPLRLLPTPSTA